jgi:PAS domain S-box-containing protein
MNTNGALAKHDFGPSLIGAHYGFEGSSALQFLFDVNMDGLLIQDPQGPVLALNRAMVALSGYDAVEARADYNFVHRLFPDADACEVYENSLSELVHSGRSMPVQTVLQTKAGGTRQVWMTLAQLDLFEQEIILTIFRERGSDPVEDSDSSEMAWVDTLIQTVGEGITLSNWEGDFRIFNRTMTEITGYTHEEANQAEDFLSLLYPGSEDYQQVTQVLYWVSETGRARELKTTITTKGGESRVLLVSTSVLRDADQLWFLSAYRDITAHERVLEALRVSEQKYKSMTEQIPLGIYRTTPDGDLIYGNPALARILGYPSLTEMIDRCFIPSMYVAEDQRQAQHRMFKTKHGVVTQEVRLRTYDDRVIWVRDTGCATFSDEGAIEYIDGTLEDITERKKTQQALQTFVEEVHARNQELDAFSRTVAHDLKNPLNLITGYAELLHDEWHGLSQETIRNGLQSMLRAAYKMSGIIEELLLLAGVRQQEVIACPIDMEQVIHEVQERMLDMVERNHAVLSVPDSWPIAWGHGPWVEEVWVNYISNAIKYGGEPPRIELGYGAEHLSSVPSRPDRICFWVRDNGKGLTDKEQAQLFAPFERLNRNQVSGHGLGLSIVRRIVEKLGGDVGVESRVGEGSFFYFILPQQTLEP